MLNRKKTILVLGAFLFVAALSLFNLPYGKFLWSTSAQPYEVPDDSTVSLPMNGGWITTEDDETLTVFGNCTANTCSVVSTFSVDDLDTSVGLDGLKIPARPGRGDWYVIIFYLGPDHLGSGAEVYQLNLYNPAGQIVSDDVLILVNPDGTITLKKNRH